jgi:soluble lytic murein transglycosylase-like protein
VTAAIAGWKNVQAGPTWVPVLNSAEQQFGIPPDLLARMAYQESHFRPEIIDGTKASPAGALGLMQLMPQYFNTVRVAVPFQPADTVAQIQQAAQLLVGLMNHFNDWTLAVAAYNDGQGNIDQYVAGTRALPAETSNYVADVLADVPLNGATLPA